MRYLSLIFCFLIAFETTTAQESDSDFPSVIPEFSIFAEDGSVFTNEDIDKRKNILFIYFNPPCGHCQKAFKTLNENLEELKIKKLKIYAVSAGTVEKTKEFFADLAPNVVNLENIEVIYDENYRFADALSVGGFPHSILYDKNHEFVKSYPGDKQILEPFKDLQKK